MSVRANKSIQSPSRQRSNSFESTKLDHSTSYRFQADIPAHIRSLLSSSQTRNPPRTPWPSDETISCHQEDIDIAHNSDCNNAGSVVEATRHRPSNLSVPLHLPLVPIHKSELLLLFEEKKHSNLPVIKSLQESARTITSLDGVDAIVIDSVTNDTITHQHLLQSCPPCPPEEASNNVPIISTQDSGTEANAHPDDCTATVLSADVGFGRKVRDIMYGNLQLVPTGQKPVSLPDPSKRVTAIRPCPRLGDFATSSTSSRSSTRPRAFLKPSGTAWKPIDLGTPVQPVLITSPETSSNFGMSGTHTNASSSHSHTHLMVTPVDALTRNLKLLRGQKSAIRGEHKLPYPSIQGDPIDSVDPPNINQAVSDAATETSHAYDAHLEPAAESLAEVALAAEECLRRSVSSAKKPLSKSEVELDFDHDDTSKRWSTCSNERIHELPNTILEEEFASFENLTPQKSSDMRMAIPQIGTLSVESQRRSWNVMRLTDPSNEAPFRYSPVPHRKFSLDSQVKISMPSSGNVPPQNHFVEHLASRAIQGVRTRSSTIASKISNPMIPYRSTSNSHNAGIKLKTSYDTGLGAHWLRQLPFGNEPDNSRLTTIPPRKHRLTMSSSKPARLFESRSEAEVEQSKPEVAENFARTINDLEHLIGEALHIAQQSAERDDAEQVPVPKDPARQPQYSRRHLRSVLRSILHSSSNSSDSASHYSNASNYVYEEQYHRTPSKSNGTSNGSMVVMLHAQPTRPSSGLPTSQVFPDLLGVKSTATCLLQKSVQDQRSDQGSKAGNEFITSMTAGVPAIRDGNTETSTYTEGRHTSELPRDEHKSHRQRMDVKPQRQTLIKKESPRITQPYEEDVPPKIEAKRSSKAILNQREVIEFIRVFHEPPIQSRHSSLALRKKANNAPQQIAMTSVIELESKRIHMDVSSQRSLYNSSLRNVSSSQGNISEVEFSNYPGLRGLNILGEAPAHEQAVAPRDVNEATERLPKRHISGRRFREKINHLKHDKAIHLNLRGKSHVSLCDHKGFSLSISHYRQPTARDWSPARKRFAASVACISTALIGLLVGIYAGEVPSIQYYIADFNHYSILGNVFFFISLAITTFFFWPLPLLHGRKPYILIALTLAMPLLFPQAIAVSMQRSPYVSTWRIMLILPRTFMGAALGFANVNFMATLTDLFGASLQSRNPHQETVDAFDVRRHGGGLGVWLGIWTWCYIGSIGVGFLIGAVVINTLSPDWGFYISIVIIAAVLLLNVVTPEVRRAAYRRSVAEVLTSKDISRRLARGEVMMHRLQTGPKWWGEEFHHGVMLSLDMLRQPGFFILSLYVAWMYGQIILTIVLLGSLMSKYYRFTSPAVGATTMAVPLGALLAVPFQKASLFSRARRNPQRTDSMTFDIKVTFSSHLIRRSIFTLVLPFAGLAYTLSSAGPPIPFILPVLFAGLIGFLSNLAIAECNGIIMETFDTSDLQPGMTGRPRGTSGERTIHKRTNYSSFPRVSSAFAIIHALGFLLGAAATGVGGVAERHIGQQAATGVMAGILLILTLGVLGSLYRFKEVQIIPNHNEDDMEIWERELQVNAQRDEEAIRNGAVDEYNLERDEPWRPVIIGNPSGKTRRMSLLELGHLSRWSEIRRKNRLVNEMSREVQRPALAALEDVRKEIMDKSRASLHRAGSKRS